MNIFSKRLSRLLDKLYPSQNTTSFPGSKSLSIEPLESRILLSAAFDLIKLTAMRSDPNFAGIDGSGIGVAVIDTGLDWTHPALASNYVAGYDFVNNTTAPTPVADHGTHVAGIVGAANPEIGVATDVDLVGLQVFTAIPGQGVGAFNQHVEAALQWVLNNQATYNILVVNMSLGSGFYTSAAQASSSIYADEIQRLEAAGVTIVSAAGNSYGISTDEYGNTIDYMYSNASSPGILSTLDVGAVWETDEGDGFIWSSTIDITTGPDRVTSFSQRPPLSEANAIFAPGAMINSTIPGGGYTEMPGTSMASPMVAGVVALMQEAAMQFGGRYLSPNEVSEIIITTGDSIYDGDDENVTAFIDSNGDYTITSNELITFDATNTTYKRVNVLAAMQEIKTHFDGSAPPPPGGDPGSGDSNATIAGAYLGPTLDGSSTRTILGSIGIDGNTVNVGDKDVDMVRFTMASPGTVTIETTSHTASPNDFDTILRLFNASGTQITSDDDGGTAHFSKIQTTLDAGTYYVGVSGYNNSNYNPNIALSGVSGSTGNYALRLSLANDDPNGLLSGAVATNLGSGGEPEYFYGNIGTDYGQPVGLSDVDMFKVVVPDNGILFIDVDTPFETGYVDSYMRIFNSSGHEITWSDDDRSYDSNMYYTEFIDPLYPGLIFEDQFDRSFYYGHTTDSFIAGGVNRGDVYYIAISDYVNQDYNPANLADRPATGSGGLYELYISFTNYDLNGSIPQAIEINSQSLPIVNQPGIIGWDGTTSGNVEVGDRDVDFIHITAPNSGLLELDVDSYTETSITDNVDTVLYLFDAAGNYLAGNDDTNSLDPLIRYQVTAGIDYYVAIVGYGNDNFDPYQLASGSPGDTGQYFFSATMLAASSTSAYADNVIGYGGIKTLTENSQITAYLGSDSGLITGPNDVDLYRYVAGFTGQVEIRTDVVFSTYNADTYLRVFNSAGTQLAANDNASETSINSSVMLNVVYGQTYYIGVNGASAAAGNYNPRTGLGAANGSQGDYALSIIADTSGPVTLAFTNGSVSFIDQNAAARLIGQGSGSLIYNNGTTNPPDIVLSGTTAAAMLMISGNATVNDITTNGSLSFLYGTTTDIAGDVNIAGSLRTLMVDDFLNGASVTIGSGAGLTAMVDQIINTTFNIDGNVNTFMASSFTGSLTSDAVSMMFIRTGDLGANITTRSGSIGTVFVPSGNITGNLNSADDISMVFSPRGSFTGTARAADNIGMVFCGQLNNAIISAGNDMNMINITGNISDTSILAGYDIGPDSTIGNGTIEDDTLSGGSIKMLMAGGSFSDSWVAAGYLPTTLPAAANAVNLGLTAPNSSIGLVRFGNVNSSSSTIPFGLYASGNITAYGLTVDAMFQINPNLG